MIGNELMLHMRFVYDGRKYAYDPHKDHAETNEPEHDERHWGRIAREIERPDHKQIQDPKCNVDLGNHHYTSKDADTSAEAKGFVISGYRKCRADDKPCILAA